MRRLDNFRHVLVRLRRLFCDAGIMIGAGVFTTSGFLLADLGPPWYVLAAWAVGGVQAALGAMCYGALARRIPESGGEYLFLSRTLHPAAGYVAGWLSLLVGFSAPLAAAAFAFGTYARPWFGGAPPPLAGTVLVLAFAAVHAAEVRRRAQVQNGAVLAKVILIVAFVAIAACRIGLPATQPDPPFPVAVFGVSLIWISWPPLLRSLSPLRASDKPGPQTEPQKLASKVPSTNQSEQNN